MSKFSSAKILVIGDIIIDTYIHTTINRLSPEAPIPVCDYLSTETRPGGAGNVAANVLALGAICKLIGVTEPKHEKIRIVSGKHQISRLDRLPDPDQYADAWIKITDDSELVHAIFAHDVVVISDYGKMPDQSIRRIIDISKTAQRFVIVDPKKRPPGTYDGANLLTPNEHEAHGLPYIPMLVTAGAKGMLLYIGTNTAIKIPAETHEVADVTGAGDTVVAVMACCQAIGMDLEVSARLANKAAGIKVTKFGTYAVTAAELGYS